MVTFSPWELVTVVITLCGLITGVAAVIGIIYGLVKKAKAPTDQLESDVAELREKINELEKSLSNDYVRFEKIEEGNKIMLKALLSLLAHGIDGNDIESMKKAKEELQTYLINQ